MNVICLSNNGKNMYGFSKYYNEFFEFNLINQTIISLGKLDNEKDAAELIFQMRFFKGKIIFIPRFAERLYIYDCETKKQYSFDVKDILAGEKYNFAGFFSCTYGRSLYLIHRYPIIISKLDMESYEYRVIKKYSFSEKQFLSVCGQAGKYVVCLAIDSQELILFDVEKETAEQIPLPKKYAGFVRPLFDGEFIWLYHDKNNMVCKCDRSGKLLREWALEHDLDMKGLHMIFSIINEKLYLFPNKQNCYFCIENDEIIMHRCKSVEGDVCWLAGDDGKNPYYICLEWDGKGDCPNTTIYDIVNFKYRKLDVVNDKFITIPVNVPKDWNGNEQYQRMIRSYQNYFSDGDTKGEKTGVGFQNFLNIIRYMEPKKKIYDHGNSKIGDSIFKRILNEKGKI